MNQPAFIDAASSTSQYLSSVAEDWAYLRIDDIQLPLTRVFFMLQAKESQQSLMAKTYRSDIDTTKSRLDDVYPKPPKLIQSDLAVKPISLKAVLEKSRKSVFLGEPGSGKSTALQFIGLSYALNDKNRSNDQSKNAPICPILIRLQVVASDLIKGGDSFVQILAITIQQKLQIQINSARFLVNHWAKHGQLLVLLDGLDEIPDGQRSIVRQQIEDFSRSPMGAEARIVLTSRPAGFTTLGGFREFVIKPFDSKQTEVLPYLTGWFTVIREDWEEIAEDKAKTLLQKIETRPALNRVLGNPLMLRLIAETYASTGEIARNRADIYNNYIKDLWARAKSRGVSSDYEDMVFNALESLAWNLKQGAENDEDVLLNILNKQYVDGIANNTREIIVLIREKLGLLARLSGQKNTIYVFAHQTLREYFIASYIKKSWAQNKHQTFDFLRTRLHLPEWQEPLFLLAGALPQENGVELIYQILNAKSPYEKYLKRDLFLATKLAGESGNWEIMRTTLLPRLRYLLRYEKGFLLEKTIEVLGFVRDKSTVLDFLYLIKNNRDIRIDAAYSLREIIENNNIEMSPEIARELIDCLGYAEDESVLQTLLDTIEKVGPSMLPELWSSFLRQINYYGSERLVQAMGRLGKAAMPYMLSLLSEGKTSFRYAALQSIANLRRETNIKYLLKSLKDKNSDVRELAAKSLGKFKNSSYLNELIETALRDEEKNVRTAAAISLAEIGDMSVLSKLSQELRGTNTMVSWAAGRALSEIGVEAVPYLRASLEDDRWWIRRIAILMMTEIGDESMLSDLKIVLRDEDILVRQSAIAAIGKFRNHKEIIIPDLVFALNDDDSRIRISALETLTEIADVSVFKFIQPLLTDENEYVRAAAIKSIPKLGGVEATRILKQAVQDSSSVVKKEALLAIGALGIGGVDLELLMAFHDEDVTVKTLALDMLQAPESDEGMIALIKSIENKNIKVRVSAVRKLGAMGESALPYLSLALRDPDADVSYAAGLALVNIGKSTQPYLLNLFQDDKAKTRRLAVEMMGKIGGKNFIAELSMAIMDKDDGVRNAAVEAIGNIKDTTMLPSLLRLLFDDRCTSNVLLALKNMDTYVALKNLNFALSSKNAGVRDAARQTAPQILDDINLPYNKKQQRQIFSEITKLNSYITRTDDLPLLSRTVERETVMKDLASSWTDPFKLSPKSERQNRYTRIVLRALSIVLVGIIGLFAVFLSSAQKALGDIVLPYFKANSILVIVASIILFASIGTLMNWAIEYFRNRK